MEGAESTMSSAVCPRAHVSIPWNPSTRSEVEGEVNYYPPPMSILKGKYHTATKMLNCEVLLGINVPLVAFLQSRGLQPVSDIHISLIIQC